MALVELKGRLISEVVAHLKPESTKEALTTTLAICEKIAEDVGLSTSLEEARQNLLDAQSALGCLSNAGKNLQHLKSRGKELLTEGKVSSMEEGKSVAREEVREVKRVHFSTQAQTCVPIQLGPISN